MDRKQAVRVEAKVFLPLIVWGDGCYVWESLASREALLLLLLRDVGDGAAYLSDIPTR